MYMIPYFRHGLIVPQTSRMSAAAAAASSGTLPSGPSVFRETPLSEGEISNNLKDELKRMKRRRQLASQNIKAQMGAGSPVISNSSINRIDGITSRCGIGLREKVNPFQNVSGIIHASDILKLGILVEKPLFLRMNDNLQDFLLVTQNEIIFHFINGRVD